MAAMIDLDAVTKQFAGKRDVMALDDVTLAIPRGEMVSIIGPSGSGKSTLLNLVGGLDRPDHRPGQHRRRTTQRSLRRCADESAARQDRLHLPVLQPAADALVPRKRRPPAAPPRLAAQESRRARPRAADPGPARSPPDPPPRGTLRRRAPARRDCPRALRLPAGPARRRTHRQPRHPHRRGNPHADPRRPQPPRLHRRHRHARHERRRKAASAPIALRDGRIVEDVRR